MSTIVMYLANFPHAFTLGVLLKITHKVAKL